MSEVIQFCEEATRWLRRDPKNVVATHCKGGKGRTGVLCSVLMLWCGHRRCAMDAMELFTFRRSACYEPEKGFGEADDVGNNPTLWSILFGKKITYNQGPEGPSQIRYVHYVEAMLYSGNLYTCVCMYYINMLHTHTHTIYTRRYRPPEASQDGVRRNFDADCRVPREKTLALVLHSHLRTKPGSRLA